MLWIHPLFCFCHAFFSSIIHGYLVVPEYVVGKVDGDVNRIERGIGVTKAHVLPGSRESHINHEIHNLFVDGQLQITISGNPAIVSIANQRILT